MKTYLSETNKLVMKIIIFIILAATLGNTVGVFKKEKSIIETVVIILLGCIVSANMIRLYKKENDSNKLRYHAFVGFFIVYIVAQVTSKTPVVFIYIIPVMFVYTLYHDVKLMKYIGAVVALDNLAIVVSGYLFLGRNSSSDVMLHLIQIIAMAVVCTSTVAVTRMTKKFNEESVGEIQEAHEKQEVILSEVLNIGSILENRSKKVSSIVSELKNASEQMNSIMGNMSEGLQETAQNISTQNQLTQSIQQIISDTSTQAKTMNELSSDAISKMDQGMKIVKELTNNTDVMNSSSNYVNESIVDLREKTKQISEITNSITAIANQTNILSLNASIESARAGEAGKGFAVVATEVGHLASQTSRSAIDISSIINELQDTIVNTFHSLEQFTTVNEQQNELIQSTEGIFNETTGNMNRVNQMISNVSHKIEEILSINDGIVKSIRVISDQSNASIENIKITSNTTEHNLEQVEETKLIADELLEAAERLNKYM